MAIHKGNELNNIRETWNQNEERRKQGAAGSDEVSGVSRDLDNTIKEEASEYDNANKEDRVLGGDRASVNDDESNNA